MFRMRAEHSKQTKETKEGLSKSQLPAHNALTLTVQVLQRAWNPSVVLGINGLPAGLIVYILTTYQGGFAYALALLPAVMLLRMAVAIIWLRIVL